MPSLIIQRCLRFMPWCGRLNLCIGHQWYACSCNSDATPPHALLGIGGNVASSAMMSRTTRLCHQDSRVRVISSVNRKDEARGRNRPALMGPTRQSQNFDGSARARLAGLAECSRTARCGLRENSMDPEHTRTHGAPFARDARTPRPLEPLIRQSTQRREW